MRERFAAQRKNITPVCCLHLKEISVLVLFRIWTRHGVRTTAEAITLEEFHLEEAGSGKSFFRKKNVNRFIAHLSFNEATARVLSHFNFFCSFIALFNSLPF